MFPRVQPGEALIAKLLELDGGGDRAALHSKPRKALFGSTRRRSSAVRAAGARPPTPVAGALPPTASVAEGDDPSSAVDAAIAAVIEKALSIALTNEQKEDIEIVARRQLVESGDKHPWGQRPLAHRCLLGGAARPCAARSAAAAGWEPRVALASPP